MNRYKKRRQAKRHEHQRVTRERKKQAALESKEAAKRAKKGDQQMVAEMEKRGYVPNGEGDFRRLHEQSLLKAQRRNEKDKPKKGVQGGYKEDD
jgi:hypothetical protein